MVVGQLMQRLWIPCVWMAGLCLLACGQHASAEMLAPAAERFSPGAEVGDLAAPDFQRHVSPLLGRMGCNGRACHGSFQGQGAFRLSLFGYDFNADHEALVKGESPRVLRDDPEGSKILEKGTESIPHKGGKRMEVDGWQYRLLARWIESGAAGTKSPAELTSLEVEPKEIVFDAKGQTKPLKVFATWEDGTREDVTCLCRFSTNNEEVAEISDEGVVTVCNPGDTNVVAYYDNGVATVEVILPVSDYRNEKYPEVPAPTRVDELVIEKLRKLGVLPSELASDAEFLRRVSLDITGTLPGPKEIEAFLADKSNDKRSKKIDELLERPSYSAWWATKFCDITGNNERHLEQAFRPEQAKQWYDWVERRIRENVPYDKLVEGILVSTSREDNQSYTDYATEMSAYLRDENPEDFASRETMPHYWSRRNFRTADDRALGVAHAFLGVRLQCAQCHKHPFDQWTQDDFKRFTAFFDRVSYNVAGPGRKEFAEMNKELGLQGLNNRELRQKMRTLANEGTPIPFKEVFIAPPPANAKPKQPKGKNPKRNNPNARSYAPKLLGDDEVQETRDDPRRDLMDWMRSPENPYFASAMVNRVWAAYFGVGIIDPPDDQNLANPPSNRALLEYLSKEFVAHNYDMKWLHREIANSRAYQTSWKPNETNKHDRRNFSHAAFRRMPAEVTYDAIFMATASQKEIDRSASDVARRAIAANTNQQIGRARYAMTAFGRPDRLTTCDCERTMEPSLVQSIYLRNDQDIFQFLDRPTGWLAELEKKYGPASSETKEAPPQPQKKKGAKAEAKMARPNGAGKGGAITPEEQMQRLSRRIENLSRKGEKEQADKLTTRLSQVQKMVAAKKKREQAAENRPPKPGNGSDADVSKGKLTKKDEVRLVREAYLRTVSRPPTKEELNIGRKYLADSPSPTGGMRDLLWALLNTKEFIVNH